MIVPFSNKKTKRAWQVKGFSDDLKATTPRKRRMLNNSINIADLSIPPSNRLEKLKGNYQNYYSIRINSRWRIIFQWNYGNAEQVEVIDYH